MSESVAVMAERLGIRLAAQVDTSWQPAPTVVETGKARGPRMSAKLGRPLADTCVNGHDLAVHRRYVKGRPKDCRACHDLRVAARRRRQRREAHDRKETA